MRSPRAARNSVRGVRAMEATSRYPASTIRSAAKTSLVRGTSAAWARSLSRAAPSGRAAGWARAAAPAGESRSSTERIPRPASLSSNACRVGLSPGSLSSARGGRPALTGPGASAAKDAGGGAAGGIGAVDGGGCAAVVVPTGPTSWTLPPARTASGPPAPGPAGTANAAANRAQSLSRGTRRPAHSQTGRNCPASAGRRGSSAAKYWASRAGSLRTQRARTRSTGSEPIRYSTSTTLLASAGRTATTTRVERGPCTTGASGVSNLRSMPSSSSSTADLRRPTAPAARPARRSAGCGRCCPCPGARTARRRGTATTPRCPAGRTP